MTAPFVEVGDIVLHAERRGDRRRPTIVFANSLGTDYRIWDAVVPALLDRYAVLLYDKRGHGLSDAPPGPYSIEDHAGDFLGLVDRMGISRFAIVGLSVGGLIAQAVAARQPERVKALVLCDTAAKIGSAELWADRIAAVTASGIASIAERILETWFPPGYRDRERAAMAGWRSMLTRQSVAGYAATCAAIGAADLREATATIRAPTLCVVGADDRSTPPDVVRRMAATIPGARFEIIADAGHLPCIDQPAALTALIREHLGEAAPW